MDSLSLNELNFVMIVPDCTHNWHPIAWDGTMYYLSSLYCIFLPKHKKYICFTCQSLMTKHCVLFKLTSKADKISPLQTVKITCSHRWLMNIYFIQCICSWRVNVCETGMCGAQYECIIDWHKTPGMYVMNPHMYEWTHTRSFENHIYHMATWNPVLYISWNLLCMTSSNGNVFCVTGPLCGDFTTGSPVKSPHKGQWHGALVFSLIGAWINSWVNNWEAGDLRCHRVHYDVTAMQGEIRYMTFHMEGLVKDSSKSSALAMELLQSCTKPSIWI